VIQLFFWVPFLDHGTFSTGGTELQDLLAETQRIENACRLVENKSLEAPGHGMGQQN
jgi:hypothetical protein